MKKLLIITVVTIISLCGCSNQAPSKKGAACGTTVHEPSSYESEMPFLQTDDSESVFPKSSATNSGTMATSKTPNIIASNNKATAKTLNNNNSGVTVTTKKKTAKVAAKEIQEAKAESKTVSSFEVVEISFPSEETKTNQTTFPPQKAIETEASKPAETSMPTVETSNTTMTEQPFDINYWISYAKNVAISKGLTLNSSAVDCWDNPTTANSRCIYLERDLSGRLSRYAKDKDITDVWIWYESLGNGEFLIYIGYA